MFKLKMIKKPILFKLKCGFTFPPIVLANMQEKEVIPTTDKQIVTPDKNYDGLSKVTVNAITLQDKTITPTIKKQIVFPDDNYNGLNKVTVNAVTNEIDENIKSENIKNGVDILGVTGNYVGSKYAPRYISFYDYKGTELDYEIANLDTSNITSMNSMFYQCSKLTTLDLSSFNTSNVTGMINMFSDCKELTTLDLSSFNTSNVTSMGYIFYNCKELTTLDVSNFDTSNVNNMTSMFYNCQSLTTLDLSSFNTSNVTSMGYMFNNCKELTTLDVSNFDTSNVTNLNQIFYNCNKLTTLDLSSFNTSNVNNMSNMFYKCQKLSNIPKLNASKVTNIGGFVSNCTSLTDFGGLENLGQAYSTTQSANYSSYKLDLSTCTALTEQSLINVLTNLYDIKTKGCKAQQVVLGNANLPKLTSEEGQQALSNAQAKGWTVS